MRFVDVQKNYLKRKDEIDRAIFSVLEKGNFILGEEVRELEEKLSQFVGVERTLGVSSGTDALLIALMALGVGPGDEVITTPLTWVATTEVIALLGARPVFVDIDPKTYLMDHTKIEAAITPATKGILPVSLFGQIPPLEFINEIAERHDLFVIEDGAQSFGAERDGVKSGALTLVGTTSFFPAKPLGCFGDGGAIFTNDLALAKEMEAIRTHGAIERHSHNRIGINGRLDTLQAAVLLAKLPHYKEDIRLRDQIGARYSAQLGQYCETPYTLPGNTHIFAQYTIRVQQREEVMARLAEEGIPTGIYYPKGVYQQPPYLRDPSLFPHTEKATKEVLSLPMHPELTIEEQDRVIEAVEAAVGALC